MDNPDAFITLRQAGRMSGYHPDYLSSLIRSGRLGGRKIGKTWVTSEAEVRRLRRPAAAAAPLVPLLRRLTLHGVPRRVAIGVVVAAMMLGLVAAYGAGFARATRTTSMRTTSMRPAAVRPAVETPCVLRQ